MVTTITVSDNVHKRLWLLKRDLKKPSINDTIIYLLDFPVAVTSNKTSPNLNLPKTAINNHTLLRNKISRKFKEHRNNSVKKKEYH